MLTSNGVDISSIKIMHMHMYTKKVKVRQSGSRRDGFYLTLKALWAVPQQPLATPQLQGKLHTTLTAFEVTQARHLLG